MEDKKFFIRWERSHKLTQDTLCAFPPEKLGKEIIKGLRSPGEMYCHIYAHISAIFGACLSHELRREKMEACPPEVDCKDRDSLLRYSRITMGSLFAHSGQSPQVWQKEILTPWGNVKMEQLCKGAYDHEVHHRGQLQAMLKHLGITAPAAAESV